MKMNEKIEIVLSRKRIRKTDFAHSIGVTYRAFANYLNGSRTPRASTLKKIADELQEKHTPVPRADRYTFEFRNVFYKYRGQETYALKTLNLTFSAGQRLAVVGLNGAGKTTFIKLLLRLYDVTEGQILCNGTDIREFDRTEYFKLFSPAFQEVEVFAFPLCENVSMQVTENTDREKAEKFLRAAGMGEKLDKLPKGIDTEMLKVVYDDGVDLSGGEKQTMALARALYKDGQRAYSDGEAVMQAASADKIERWMQAYAALCREDNPACSEENARLAVQALEQEDYERLKWRVLKRFGVLPSEMRARRMTDREYLYCAAQLLLDEQEKLEAMCPACREKTKRRLCPACG